MTADTTLDETRWLRCSDCDTVLYVKKLARNLHVCPECGGNRRLTADDRIEQLTDVESFVSLPVVVTSADRLGFTDSRPYPDRLASARAATGMAEAVRCGTARIGGRLVALAVMDFRFMGGSLGSGVGELITLTAELALRERLPMIIVTASGGARMQEGVLSLMQMAKTSQALGRMREAGLLTVSVITDPTFGGVAASFATSCDAVVAESGARMGFAGPRVISQVIKQDLPDGFQTAEFLFEHGQIDAVTTRRDLRGWIERLLTSTAPVSASSGGGPEILPVVVRDSDLLEPVAPWAAVALARDVGRPTSLEHLDRVFDVFVELHGDRCFGDDPAIVAGLARCHGWPVAVIGHQKGHTTRELVAHNFGMPRPEGYRKALRVMRLAARLGIPLVTLVDTPGAYPGVEAEERGQAGVIAEAILEMTMLTIPIVTLITGEGGSGGALALAVGDQVLMMENSIYSVISPEGASAILWGDAAAAPRAAEALGITAREVLALGVVDGVVPEPHGGAPVDPARASELVGMAVAESLAALHGRSVERLVEERRQRFRAFGVFETAGPVEPVARGVSA